MTRWLPMKSGRYDVTYVCDDVTYVFVMRWLPMKSGRCFFLKKIYVYVYIYAHVYVYIY